MVTSFILTKLGLVQTESTPSTDKSYTDKGVSAGVLTATPGLNLPVDRSFFQLHIYYLFRDVGVFAFSSPANVKTKQHKSDLRKWIIPVQMQVAVVLFKGRSIPCTEFGKKQPGRNGQCGMVRKDQRASLSCQQ